MGARRYPELILADEHLLWPTPCHSRKRLNHCCLILLIRWHHTVDVFSSTSSLKLEFCKWKCLYAQVSMPHYLRVPHLIYSVILLILRNYYYLRNSGTTSQPRHLHNVFIQPQDKHQVTRPDDISLANLPSKWYHMLGPVFRSGKHYFEARADVDTPK